MQILESALALLTEKGDAGLTMRKLADRAGMRLSNVQYYFKSRDDVLKAMVALYFDDCAQRLLATTNAQTHQSTRDRIHFVFRFGLSHGEEISDMCRTFRELWAIASRNTAVHDCLMAYYQRFADVLVAYALADNVSDATRQSLKCLIVPFIEGYSVTAPSLPLGAAQLAELLTDLAMSLVDEG